MNDSHKTLGIIAGNRDFPLIFAQAARKNGIGRIVAVAFEGETRPELAQYVDVIEWVRLGRLNDLVAGFKKHGVRDVVMVGQIAPDNLFKRVSLDVRMTLLLARLGKKNAETIFGSIGEEIAKDGLHLVPHASYLGELMPGKGVLTGKKPDKAQLKDIAFGFDLAKRVAGMDVGQTVVVKEGTVLSVEALEGTDAALLRGGRLGQGGAVAVKVTKPGQDMRFDIPVVGMTTLESAHQAGIAVLAFEADKTLLLEKERMVSRADELGIILTAV